MDRINKSKYSLTVIIIINVILTCLSLVNDFSLMHIMMICGFIIVQAIAVILFYTGIATDIRATLLSSLALTLWLDKPMGMVLAFLPTILILFGCINQSSDKLFVVKASTKLELFLYGLIMYSVRIYNAGFDAVDFALCLIFVIATVYYSRIKREEAVAVNRRLSMTIEEMSHDVLTGLRNRASFDDKIYDLSKRINSFAVIMIDIDHFKKVNDTYGHLNGDIVLKGLAKTIEATIRGTDTSYRFGGEEFVILCGRTNAKGAYDLAERLRNNFANYPFNLDGKTEHFTISLGVAECPHGEFISSEDIIEKADEALYVSKNNGRNRTTMAVQA